MPTLYLVDHGAKLRHDHRRLLVEIDGAETQTLPLAHIEDVVVSANAHITTATLKLLLYEGVDVVFLTESGHFCGRLSGPPARNGGVRRNQYAASLSDDFALGVAQACVAAKLRNMRTLLLRYNRLLAAPELGRACDLLAASANNAQTSDNKPSLLGIEGSGTAAYFGVLARLFKHDWGFDGRNRRPPRDPINVLLSFAYTLLARAVEDAVLTAGLDSSIGFLHEPEFGRASLALDLMEEFRPIVADSTVLRCLNTEAITPADFSPGQDATRPIVLSQTGAKALVREFEARCAIEFAHPASSERVTYKRCFELQARELARAIRERNAYRAFVVR
jgi:CRISPR-associated protein Cas1